MRVFLLDKSYSGGDTYPLKSRDIKYLEKVLRLEDGVIFTAKDEKENYYKATFQSSGYLFLEKTDNPEETLLDTLSSYTGPFAKIDMYVSLLKGKKNETVVRALTEIGVRRIVFVTSEFCQEKDFNPHQKERLELIEKEAVQQSGGKTPTLEGPVPYFEAVKEAEGIKILLHQAVRGATKSLKDVIFSENISEDVISVFVGPEGGFSNSECINAENMGFIPVLLRTNVLRAETASIYIASSLQTLLH